MEATTNDKSTKRKKIFYWIFTIWAAFGMLSTGVMQIMRSKAEVDMVMNLGFPVYILSIIGVWKVMGVIAILIPKFPLLKEWAYAGFFFAMSGAFISHSIVGDGFKDIFPSLFLLIIAMLSWWLRPVERKLIAGN